MAKRKLTVGETISAELQWFGWVDVQRKDFAAKRIDRAIRRARAEAFDEGASARAQMEWDGTSFDNPYRKVKR